MVAIPYWKTPQYIERAVRSVLAQTHKDLICVVIGDGDHPQLDLTDSRLIVHWYAINHGAYFAQDVAIWANPFEWYAIVASDDWLEPDHIERLLSHQKDMACGALYAHGESRNYCGSRNNGHTACRGVVVHKAYEVGIYRTERYREIGAHNPTERIGQDSLTLRLMRLVGPVGATTVPTYNRLFRPGSLCTDPATAKGSRARQLMRHRNAAILSRCQQLRTPARIREYRQSLIPAVLQAALSEQVASLRAKLS